MTNEAAWLTERLRMAEAELQLVRAARDVLREQLSIWKSVFPDIAPERVLPDRSKFEAEFDANVNRLKACEHIADGDEGWARLREECPSTAAVARLRDALAAAERQNSDLQAANNAYLERARKAEGRVVQLEAELSNSKAAQTIGCGLTSEDIYFMSQRR